jgi:hypothetical protein
MHKLRMIGTTRTGRCRYIPRRVPEEYDTPGTAPKGVGEEAAGMYRYVCSGGECRYEIDPNMTPQSYLKYSYYIVYICILYK